MNSNAETKTYVEFDYPGSFYPESSVREVLNRDVDALDIPDGVFAFYFFDVMIGEVNGVVLKSGRMNLSPKYFYGGRIMTLDEVEAEVPDSRILQDNMRINGWNTVIQCRTHNFQPFRDTDIYIAEPKQA